MADALELGPWLGVVSSPRSRPAPGQVPLDDIRIDLVGRLLVEAHQPRPDWMAAWQLAVERTTARTQEFVVDRAARAAQSSLAPERIARQAVPSAEDLGILRTRAESAGIPLEVAARAADQRPDIGHAFSRIGGAVEESWLDLERVVAGFAREWAGRAGWVSRWRRPATSLWVASGLVVVAALVAGLVLGGYLPAPAWLAPIVAWWWSLPWP